MPIAVRYAYDPATGAPRRLSSTALWAVAAALRRQLRLAVGAVPVTAEALLAAAQELLANGRLVRVSWDLSRPVHDPTGRPVLGVCETDPDLPGTALVSVNACMTAGRPDLALSTAAHELGHVVFDVPAALGEAGRRFRAVTADPDALRDGASALAKWRANEFMGALLAPPVPLQLRLLLHARAEGLRTVHAAHHGRQGSRILASGNPPEAVAGVIAALAGDFGVSESFIHVRLERYRLVEGGLAR
ncbi:ImmA/IrrE family metallo-endopeptidase [Crenalkalicoccus roseus]|uniref:ImmA/IrrE family metallo-endopeptidase n=1 Tax=Crenalkalicoccus roseus TaxID=1485588 RepID=UPI0010811B32|nr:hypothetical protein [Crenalkalicoccus roseus]